MALVTGDMHFEGSRETLAQQLPEAQEIAMTIAEELRNQGREEGREEGRATECGGSGRGSGGEAGGVAGFGGDLRGRGHAPVEVLVEELGAAAQGGGVGE